MQVSLYLELAHELGILPVARVHSAHPVVHQRPTLHATELSLGRGMKPRGRTFSEVSAQLVIKSAGHKPWQNR